MGPIETQRSRHPDPLRQDLADVKTDLGAHLLAEGASPVRKQARRQSLPARLSPPAGSEYKIRRGGQERLSLGLIGSRKHHLLPSTSAATADADPEHFGLSTRQRRYYPLVMKIGRRVTTLPLPMTVTSANGCGDFFDRGDIAPRQATVIVRGMEDPLVRRLELGQLLSVALAERARRRNEQMATFVNEALRGRNKYVGTHGDDGGGDNVDKVGGSSGGGDDDEEVSKRWWIKLCANKHLKDDENLKRVRDGEPLGSVADGVEWALRHKIHAYRARIPGERSGEASTPRYREDVAILVKVARQWAAVLTWSQVANGTWSYEGITAKMLKEGIYSVDVVVELRKRQAPVGSGDRWSSRSGKTGREAWRRQRTHLPREDAIMPCSEQGCAPPDDVEPADDDDEFTLVWSPRARDVGANLAKVLRKEGREEAMKEAATAIHRRIEVMARGCAVLRVALKDLVEGKGSEGMQDGDNSTAVTEACLLWLKDIAAAKIAADWARNAEAVSQTVACIELSIKLKAKVSDAAAIWLKSHARTRRGDVIPAPFITAMPLLRVQREETSTVASSSAPTGSELESGGVAVTEDAFVELKRSEAKQAQETDTLAVMMHHALYLLLPCQPVKFHFVWGRFMRFYHERDLYQHVSRYYTDVVRNKEVGLGSGAKSSATGRDASAAGGGSDSGRRSPPRTGSARGQGEGGRDSTSSGIISSTSRDSDNSHEAKDSRRISSGEVNPPSRLVCRQVAGNLVKPRHMDHMEFRPSYFVSPPAGSAQGQSGAVNGSRAGAAVGGVGKGGEEREGGHVSALSQTEAAVANECLVSLLAMHGTESHLATGPQVVTALRREGFPNEEEALTLLRDVDALRSRGVRDRLWRGRRGAVLVRARVRASVFARLPPEVFHKVLVFLAS